MEYVVNEQDIFSIHFMTPELIKTSLAPTDTQIQKKESVEELYLSDDCIFHIWFNQN